MSGSGRYTDPRKSIVNRPAQFVTEDENASLLFLFPFQIITSVSYKYKRG